MAKKSRRILAIENKVRSVAFKAACTKTRIIYTLPNGTKVSINN